MVLAKLGSFYLTVLIIISLCFFYILIFATIIPLIKNAKAKKTLFNYLDNESIKYIIKRKNSNEYDFSILIDEKEYFVKLIDIKKNSDINVSNNKTLVMYYKDITNATKSKEIVDVKGFIESKLNNKIILLNSDINKITLSKNENEVIDLSILDKVNNTLIITCKDFNQLIKK